jgi:CBS domain-containing protein
MIAVQQLLNEKGHRLWSIHPDKSTRDAMKIMMERDIGSLLVIADARLLGIVTERQCARSVICDGQGPAGVIVRDIMEPPLSSVGPNNTIEECMTLMTERRVRYLPVLRHGNLLGILSIGDLVKWVISDQRTTIMHLEHYIHGAVPR